MADPVDFLPLLFSLTPYIAISMLLTIIPMLHFTSP